MSDYFGLPTGVLENKYLKLEYLLTAGPRIVRLSRTGGTNVFAEIPEFFVETPRGPYHFRGGHRLWAAPERMPETYHPDNLPVQIENIPDGVNLTQAAANGSPITKSMEVQLGNSSASLSILHTLRNDGTESLVIAPWALTMCRLGGTVIFPQCSGNVDAAGYLPNRNWVLWPYTQISDPRLVLRDDAILIRAQPNQKALKVGCFNSLGWMAYWTGDTFFKKGFQLQAQAAYPDLGCNSESYCKDLFIELESLGPLSTVAPGQSIIHQETWELYDSVDLPFITKETQSLLA